MADPVVQMKGVSFSCRGTPVLKDVNLEIEHHEFASIVGPNGGGKTTLVKLILGLLQPDSGSIRVFGLPPARARQRIGYVPQHYEYDAQFPVRVIDVVLMGRLDQTRRFGPYRRADYDAADHALRHVDLFELRGRLLAELSGGQQQRVLIARALAVNPALLLLDEPTASLDLAVEAELYELLRKLHEDLTVVMVTHDLGFVSGFVTKVICVKQNVVVHPTSEITGEIISEMYGTHVHMVRHDQMHTDREPKLRLEG